MKFKYLESVIINNDFFNGSGEGNVMDYRMVYPDTPSIEVAGDGVVPSYKIPQYLVMFGPKGQKRWFNEGELETDPEPIPF